MSRILKYIKNPWNFLILLGSRNIMKIDDKKYLNILYKRSLKKELNLENPQTFNDKMQWLKIYDRKAIYTKMADKYEAKKYVSNLVGKEYIIPTLGIYNSFDEIDFNKLPNSFVMKCTHDSGGLVICTNKKKLNIKKAKVKINKSLKRNYFYKGREWPYKNIKPRIIIEKYIKDDLIDDLRDYKFMCFNGKVKYVYVTVKNDNIWENYYDADFNIVNINHGFPRYKDEFVKPINFNKMKYIAEALSKNTPFLRVDLHNINGKILFGEMTFYDWGGFRPFPNIETDYDLGKMIDLKAVKKNEK